MNIDWMPNIAMRVTSMTAVCKLLTTTVLYIIEEVLSLSIAHLISSDTCSKIPFQICQLYTRMKTIISFNQIFSQMTYFLDYLIFILLKWITSSSSSSLFFALCFVLFTPHLMSEGQFSHFELVNIRVKKTEVRCMFVIMRMMYYSVRLNYL